MRFKRFWSKKTTKYLLGNLDEQEEDDENEGVVKNTERTDDDVDDLE